MKQATLENKDYSRAVCKLESEQFRISMQTKEHKIGYLASRVRDFIGMNNSFYLFEFYESQNFKNFFYCLSKFFSEKGNDIFNTNELEMFFEQLAASLKTKENIENSIKGMKTKTWNIMRNNKQEDIRKKLQILSYFYFNEYRNEKTSESTTGKQITLDIKEAIEGDLLKKQKEDKKTA